MSTTATVAVLPLTGPAPRAPRHSLLARALDPGAEYVRRGIWFDPYPPGVPVTLDQCATGTFADKGTPDETILPDAFQPFMGYLGQICTAMSIGEEWAAWKGKADAALQARRSWLLERQLMNATYADMPHLGDSNVNVFATALPVAAAIAQLEAFGAKTGQEYWLHVPPEVVAFGGFDLFQEDRGGILRTATGAPVVVGQGYSQDDNTAEETYPQAFAPTGAPPSGQAAAGDQESWIYVSGPVYAGVGDQIFFNPDTMSEARDWEQNTVVYRAEQVMVVGWDGQLQAAALADWSGS